MNQMYILIISRFINGVNVRLDATPFFSYINAKNVFETIANNEMLFANENNWEVKKIKNDDEFYFHSYDITNPEKNNVTMKINKFII